MEWGEAARHPMIRSAKAKARKRRAEKKVIDVVRPKVEARDGPCRLGIASGLDRCAGPSQWAHFGDYKRFKTRGMDPEERHTTQGSLMLCDFHHDCYDEHSMMIEPLTDEWCDGPLRFSMGGRVYEEPDL